MRVLLDTHVFLWYIKDSRELSKKGKCRITDATEVYVSSASIWELTIKVALRKLDANIDHIIDAIAESGFMELPINVHHAASVTHLANIHRDPFDRMLIAQAIYEPLTFLTADTMLTKYSDLVEVIH